MFIFLSHIMVKCVNVSPLLRHIVKARLLFNHAKTYDISKKKLFFS